MSHIKKTPVFWIFLVLGPFAIGIMFAHLTQTSFTEDHRFEKFADELFENEVKGNTINLHYTLADPKEYGIHNYPLTLGALSRETIQENADSAEQLFKELEDFDYQELSRDNQILYDTLDYILKTESEAGDYPLLYEPLSPTLGIQAQLPILLAEYAFRNEQDIQDYLELLNHLKPYFEEILSYEQEKSSAGCFMNRDTAYGIIAQCSDFIADKDNHYLLTVFNDKIENCTFLSEKKKEKYKEKNQAALLESCFPAYELLIEGITDLSDTGTNDYGLYYLEDGKEYYAHLVESTTGIYDSVEMLEERLYGQLYHDYMQIQRLYTAYPDIAETAEECLTTISVSTNPEDILSDLQSQMMYDFPDLKTVEYDVKYVDSALQEHLSPAFYLTPPVDTGSPNSIYLNPDNDLTGITLYTTLAHEGFPGHLYQTQYFSQTDSHPLLSLLSNGGYVEGWATYIENFAYQYAPVSYEVSQYLINNRSFQLCLYSVLDIGIHYHGWKPERANQLLSAVGIYDEFTQKEIYQTLLEDPANYLKYCAGSIYLMDICDKVAQLQGSEFDISNFHKKVLETGPVPFPVLAKYLYLDS